MNRRQFLAVYAMGPRAAAASDTVRVAIVGLRGRGRDHIHEFAAISGVEIATLCDVDETVLTNRLDDAERLTGKRPAGQTDYRNVVDDKSVDVVVIATPDHWHTLQVTTTPVITPWAVR
jgi:predicted dehydrogenase